MKHQDKILKLADYLDNLGLEKEALELLALLEKSAVLKPPAIDDWYKVIEEVDSPYVDTAYQAVRRYLSGASGHLTEANKGLQGARPEDIKAITDNIPLEQLVSQATKRNNLVKYAAVTSEDVALVKAAEFCVSQGWIERPNYKRANWWKYVKMIGGATLKYVVPFVSLLFAIINFYYCAVELSKLMSEAPDVGMAWHEPVFNPGKTLQKAQENLEDPKTLRKLAKVNKTGKTFADEAISMVANGIDGVKDIIFLIVDIVSAGTSIWLDLGISFVIMIIEWLIEGAVLPIYDQATQLIRDKAADEITTYYTSKLDTDIKEKFQDTEEIDFGFTPEELSELTTA